MMTPERRAEIEAKIAKPYADDVDGYRSTEMKCAFMDAAIPEELLAEIDRLTADRDQLSSALDLASAELEAQTKEIDRLNKVVDQAISWITSMDNDIENQRYPELAAELERRSKA